VPRSHGGAGEELIHIQSVYHAAMAIRKQILVPEDVDARLRRLATQRGVSQSALIGEAIRGLPDADEQLARTMAFVGSIKGGPPSLSDEVDETIYKPGDA
jgi:predicted transcriptional regulator